MSLRQLGLDDVMVKGKFTPAESTPLVKDTVGEEACGSFSYSSVVEMLLFFQSILI